MKITGLKVNHKVNPLGYDFPALRFEWTVEEAAGTKAEWVQVTVREAAPDGRLSAVYDSGRILPDEAGGLTAQLVLKPGTRYVWQVTAASDAGETATSETAWFETGKPGEWTADWLEADPNVPSVCFEKPLLIEKPVAAARLYICGLGLYEAYLDERKLGDEFLMPGYHSYDLTQEYQTIDATAGLTVGAHTLSVMLGNGWYKGRFVFEGGFENLYGDRLKLIAELHITYADGTKQVIGTDDTWAAHSTCIGANSIYDGEVQDPALAGKPVSYTAVSSGKELLSVRTSMPIRVSDVVNPVEILRTPAGETVLDFGQMITGWVSVYCREAKGTAIRLCYSELLQGGNFYRDNLRTAKAEFAVTSDGEEKWLRPHFTYYGFRYVKVEGISEVRASDFRAVRLLSEIYPTGSLETGNAKVNRLIANVQASQKCNFLSIPTDCPQRDERMGWTGDIAIFADTACMNADCAGFLSHFMELVAKEQKLLNGAVPLYVPRPKVDPATPGLNIMILLGGSGISVWGDAGAILPWRIYEHRRDKALLEHQYPIMRAWVDFVKGRISENPKPHLWQNDTQLGDWLALDSGEDSLFGLTDSGYLATACYYYCLGLTRRAAEILGKADEAAQLREEQDAVREAFAAEFLAPDGTITVTETQTAYALLLAYGLFRPGQEGKAVERLIALVEAKDNHLDTGFLGTAWLCEALSMYGGHETACKVFLQESYPGWLHEVNLGAVTTWERWNSINEDGTVSSTGMNSMNHYAYGSIASWMYRCLCGFIPEPEEPCTMTIRPQVCRELGTMSGSYAAPWGTYKVTWTANALGADYKVTVPFGGTARLILPGREAEILGAGTHIRKAGNPV